MLEAELITFATSVANDNRFYDVNLCLVWFGFCSFNKTSTKRLNK